MYVKWAKQTKTCYNTINWPQTCVLKVNKYRTIDYNKLVWTRFDPGLLKWNEKWAAVRQVVHFVESLGFLADYYIQQALNYHSNKGAEAWWIVVSASFLVPSGAWAPNSWLIFRSGFTYSNNLFIKSSCAWLILSKEFSLSTPSPPWDPLCPFDQMPSSVCELLLAERLFNYTSPTSSKPQDNLPSCTTVWWWWRWWGWMSRLFRL